MVAIEMCSHAVGHKWAAAAVVAERQADCYSIRHRAMTTGQVEQSLLQINRSVQIQKGR
jgi:hypothetical protein